jgi:tRNA pseudouridine38-40 synthase
LRYFIELSYNGSKYHGWQIQKNKISVEEVLEQCIYDILHININICGVGRTDKGVHAKQFFAHFDYPREIYNSFVRRLNNNLPEDIRIYNIYLMTQNAHARFSVLTRKYEYFISLQINPNIDLMNTASVILKRYEDYSSFCKKSDHITKYSSICKIYYIKWSYLNNLLCFEIIANRFVRNMVRSIVSTIVDVGRNKINIFDIYKIIESKAISKAEAKGLFLSSIIYPKCIFIQYLRK